MIADAITTTKSGIMIDVETGLNTIPNEIWLKIWTGGEHPTVVLTVRFHGEYILTPKLNEEFLGAVLDDSRSYPVTIRCHDQDSGKVIDERTYILPPSVRTTMWRALTSQERANKEPVELQKVGCLRAQGCDGEPDEVFKVSASGKPSGP